ncbi:class I SAM-dependent methyltransferase [Thermosynechococcus sp. GLH187]|uniref:class I SAM-dependent methyltransferase n=1 Tax=unclassified Thermosynechococcus TaxID=2622553 RepID=UPI002873C58E|nr:MULTISPECIES: class I SAM-dependent methyltransferase [unclassified Thermosynechococcus]WNC22415.1 class I SAM-dependent methyltransferase [Thermosynechococcus sp. PP22]WNC45263.1 class I SAM-dependent methyltransferase [Thermosynechococcus sp. GLH187]WNC47799.1 class I SAM-dependent methyltransferase [Thermosynechococcus sp. GLH333]WNC50335.1 class I SAM-dependent methyltransferase [Thermosynechococcus sp. GLH87]
MSNQLTRIETIYHWKCPETDFEWYTPAEAAGDGSLYQQLQKFPWYYMSDKWEFHAALDYIQPSSKVLEVGIGGAGFLQLARRNGVDIEGMEINPEAIQNAQKLGFIIYPVSIDEFLNQYPDQKYDAICAFQVIEHIPDPISFLTKLINILQPNGKLILSVPNSEVLRKIDPSYENLLDQPPHHMSHWCKSVFNYLPNILPLEVTNLLEEPLQSYHVEGFVVGYCRSFLKTKLRLPNLGCRLLANYVTLSPISLLLKLGISKMLPGHTLLAVLTKKA